MNSGVQDYALCLMEFDQTWWEDGEWAKQEPIKIWCGSR